MAIKTISQLDQFDNNTPEETGSPQTGVAIGGDLHWFDDTFLTDEDQTATLAENWENITHSVIANNKYWDSLFEISKTENYGELSGDYFSQKIPYKDLIKNIIWDVNAFLNYRHCLSNYNLYKIVDGNQTFHGTKNLTGNIYINGNLSATNISSTYGNIAHLSSNTISVDELTAFNLSATYLSALNFLGDYININTSLSLGPNISAIETGDNDIFFKGWAIGLKDLDGNKRNEGKIWQVELDQTTSVFVGNPVYFEDGVPKELSIVNQALCAYTLINKDGTPVNAGNGCIRESVPGITDTAHEISDQYSAMFIHDGIISATNVIDFANHAFWSDLGERYLADDVYEPGTLVKFGGEKEITIADTEVNAIVSTKAFDLNAGLAGGTVIALCGRVPTKIKGKIKKFDKIMLSNIPGIACKWDGNSRVIGCALESSDDEKIKLVECVTRFTI